MTVINPNDERKKEAMKELLSELQKGLQSAEEYGWISEEEFNFKHFGASNDQ